MILSFQVFFVKEAGSLLHLFLRFFAPTSYRFSIWTSFLSWSGSLFRSLCTIITLLITPCSICQALIMQTISRTLPHFSTKVHSLTPSLSLKAIPLLSLASLVIFYFLAPLSNSLSWHGSSPHAFLTLFFPSYHRMQICQSIDQFIHIVLSGQLINIT